MNKHFTQLLLIAILLTACGPAVLPPPPTAIVTQTIAPSQTPTSRPTQTAIPTATPYPSLQTQGPYLLFTYDNKNFTIMDADGSGRREFQLPNDGYAWNLEKAISPDGKWLAYFTGSSQEEPYDLALNLFDLKDEITTSVAKLIAPSFPENLKPVKIAEPILLGDCESESCHLDILKAAFLYSIKALDWSPDSQFLAFAAQIDGPSSDVYIFSITDRSIRQLVNDLENIGSVEWSPNGTRILYTNSTPGATYTPSYIYVANPKNINTQSPKAIDGGLFWTKHGWITDNSYLISNSGEGAPPQHIRYINTDTLLVKEIWPNEAQYVSIDRENHQVVLAKQENSITDGIYIVSISGNYTKISNTFYYLFNQQDASDLYFGLDWLANETNQLIGIHQDGSATSLSRKVYYDHPPVISPDKKYIVITSGMGTELYSESLQLIKSWGLFPDNTIWRPDSKGIFLYNEYKLYYLSVPDGEPTLIDGCASKDCYPFNYTWLP